MDRSAMAGASVSVAFVNVQTRSFKDKLVRRVRPALVSVLNIKNVFSAEPSIKEKRKTRVHRSVHIST
jgi:prophage tail gpP-like protein